MADISLLSNLFGNEGQKGDDSRILEVSKLQTLGFKQVTSLQDGLQKTLEWFLQNKNLYTSRYNAFKETF